MAAVGADDEQRGDGALKKQLDRPSPEVVVAIPTIAARGDAWTHARAAFQRHTCQPVRVIPSWAPGGWAAGLNEVWEAIKDDPPQVLVCGSDDMIPEDDNWLPPLLDHIARTTYPAPTVTDPRFTNYGGHLQPVPDGTPAWMSTFPVMAGLWGNALFPLPDDLSYYADNLIAVKLRLKGIECVAVPSSRITHLMLDAGRGFGHGTEQKAMIAHSFRYSEALEELGVDRGRLPASLRGPHMGVKIEVDPDAESWNPDPKEGLRTLSPA